MTMLTLYDQIEDAVAEIAARRFLLSRSEAMTAAAVAMPQSTCRDVRLGFGESGELNAHLETCGPCRQWWAELIAAEDAERDEQPA